MLKLRLSPCFTCWKLVQKKYKEEGKRKASISLYSQLPDTPEIQRALEVSQLQSEVRSQPQRRRPGNMAAVLTRLRLSVSAEVSAEG